MSKISDLPGSSYSELDSDDDAVFDELASRAGAALRRPAPADGMRVIAARQRRQRALRASALGGIAVATLIGALLVVDGRKDTDPLARVGASPPSEAAATETQFASAVAAGRAPLDEWIDEESNCDHIECGFPIYVTERYEMLPSRLRALRNDLENLGNPPAEIADLVDRTSEGLDAAASQVESFLTCAHTHRESSLMFMSECTASRETAERGWRAVSDLLAAWESHI